MGQLPFVIARRAFSWSLWRGGGRLASSLQGRPFLRVIVARRTSPSVVIAKPVKSQNTIQ